jgi:hypothetical protein
VTHIERLPEERHKTKQNAFKLKACSQSSDLAQTGSNFLYMAMNSVKYMDI